MNLSEPQKKYLRGLGHELKPLIMLGNAGLSDAVLAEFELTIAHHELIKVKVRSGDRDVRNQMIEKLCADAKTMLIQRIGNVALLYRANHDKKKDKRIKIPSR